MKKSIVEHVRVVYVNSIGQYLVVAYFMRGHDKRNDVVMNSPYYCQALAVACDIALKNGCSWVYDSELDDYIFVGADYE